MTELLYLRDSYAREFDAMVTAVNGKEVILDRTYFYPSGGGQPFDTGTISTGGAFYSVVNVHKGEHGVVHELDHDDPKVGDVVHGAIDWERRYKLMRFHTAIHVLVGVICNETGALITGNQIDVDKSRIDFNLEIFDREKMQEHFEKANAIIQQDLPVTVTFTTREEALQIPRCSSC